MEEYSVRLDKEEEEVLRAALEASLKGSDKKLPHRLMRDQKKLHQLYSQLTWLGFGVEEVEACLAEIQSNATLPDCLDWCAMHLADHQLPPAFRVTGSGDDTLPAAQPQVDKVVQRVVSLLQLVK